LRAMFRESRFMPEAVGLLEGGGVRVLDAGVCVAPKWCGHGSTFSWDGACGWWIEINLDDGNICVWERISRYVPPSEQATDAEALFATVAPSEVPELGRSAEEVVNPPEASRSYSSVLCNDAVGAGLCCSCLDSIAVWSAQINEVGQWMEIDLGGEARVVGVVTQGRCGGVQWVKKFVVKLSVDGREWGNVLGEFDGGRPDEKSEARFASPLAARYVRLVVTSWEGHISMRAGVIVSRSSSSLSQASERDEMEGNAECPARTLSAGSRTPAPKLVLEESRALVRCKRGHPLARKVEETDWICDGQHEPGGCLSGGGRIPWQRGDARYRCGECDYDLCHKCYTVRGMQQLSPKSAKGKAFPSPLLPEGSGDGVGQEYELNEASKPLSSDFSFPVEVEEGSRRLTIQWSRGDNPQQVAQDFARQHGIPSGEVSSICDFVVRAQEQASRSAKVDIVGEQEGVDAAGPAPAMPALAAAGEAGRDKVASQTHEASALARRDYPWAESVEDFMPELFEEGDGFSFSLDRTSSGEYWNVVCPHCGGWFRVKSTEVNCTIFRHAVRRDNFEMIPPHSSQETCERLVAEEQVYGCGKPIRFDPKKWQTLGAVVTKGHYSD